MFAARMLWIQAVKDTSRTVISPPLQFPSKFPCPRTYLIPSILVTLCACIPAGVTGIIFATKVKQKYQQNDYNAALSASNNAKLSCIVGGSIGVLSRISDLSAYNNNANNPPEIIDENNQVIGILSVNTQIQGVVDPDLLHTAMCKQ